MEKTGTRQHSRLVPVGHRAVRRTRAVRLGWTFLIVLVVGVAIIAAWTLVHLGPGADVIGVVSFGVSAAVTLIVALLALVAVINFISSIAHWPYIWILPDDFASIRLDWPIAVAIAAGVALGWRFWQ